MDDFRAHVKNKVILFLRKQIYDSPAEQGPCLKFVLRHLRADGSPTSDIETYIVPRYLDAKDAPSMDQIETGADDLVNAALDDAAGLNRGVQRYVVLAFHDKRPGEHSSRCIIRVTGGQDTFSQPSESSFGVGEVSDTETPDARGITAQHMRHTEAFAKIALQASGHAIKTLTDQNLFLSTHLQKFMEKHIQTMHLVETLISNQHTRELESKKQAVIVRGLEDMADKIKILLPHMVNRAVGRKLLPTKSSPEEQELVALIETLRPEQLDQVRQHLSADQSLALVSIIERVLGKTAEDAADSGAPPENPAKAAG